MTFTIKKDDTAEQQGLLIIIFNFPKDLASVKLLAQDQVGNIKNLVETLTEAEISKNFYKVIHGLQ